MTDLLSSAISAARARAEDGADDGAATRLRIRESLAARGAGRRNKWTLLAAVIGTLFGSTAFALHQGWTPPWSSPAAAVEPATVMVDEPPAIAPRRRTPSLEQPHVAPPAREVAAAREEPEALAWTAGPRGDVPVSKVGSPVSANASTPVSAAAGTPTAGPDPEHAAASAALPAPRVTTSVRAEPNSPAIAPDPELAAYRVAHAAHFRGTDAQAALAAWDDYLAKFPDGRMALDARYDRALVLVRLERWSQARAALAPFAAASSTYRKLEAARILDAIRAR